MTKPISIAVIGAGSQARTVLIPTLARVEELRLRAVATAKEETARAAEERYGVPASADWRAVVARADIDAVIVSTPAHLHEEVALAALEAGKHALIETPVCASAAAARRVQAAADRRGLVAQGSYNFRYGTAFAELERRLGEAPSPRLFLYEYFPWTHHIVDLSLHLSGPWERVLSTTGDAAGNATTLRFRNGDTAVIVGRALANCSLDIERVSVSGQGFFATVEGRRRVRVAAGMRPTPYAEWSIATAGSEVFEPQPCCARFEDLSGYAPQLRAFARAIRGGERPRCTVGDAAETHDLLAAIAATAAPAVKAMAGT